MRVINSIWYNQSNVVASLNILNLYLTDTLQYIILYIVLFIEGNHIVTFWTLYHTESLPRLYQIIFENYIPINSMLFTAINHADIRLLTIIGPLWWFHRINVCNWWQRWRYMFHKATSCNLNTGKSKGERIHIIHVIKAPTPTTWAYCEAGEIRFKDISSIVICTGYLARNA